MLWNNISKVIILILSVAVIVFNAVLYISFKQQSNEIITMKDTQNVETQFNSNKFKYLQDQIDRLSKDLDSAQQQIKDQNEAMSDQKEENKNIQTSLVDIKAEADAIKQNMKGWQKDYVGILAQLGTGIENIQEQIKSLHDNLNSLNGTISIPEKQEVKGKDENQL